MGNSQPHGCELIDSGTVLDVMTTYMSKYTAIGMLVTRLAVSRLLKSESQRLFVASIRHWNQLGSIVRIGIANTAKDHTTSIIKAATSRQQDCKKQSRKNVIENEFVKSQYDKVNKV
jgi:hypothetical protein